MAVRLMGRIMVGKQLFYCLGNTWQSRTKDVTEIVIRILP